MKGRKDNKISTLRATTYRFEHFWVRKIFWIPVQPIRWQHQHVTCRDGEILKRRKISKKRAKWVKLTKQSLLGTSLPSAEGLKRRQVKVIKAMVAILHVWGFFLLLLFFSIKPTQRGRWKDYLCSNLVFLGIKRSEALFLSFLLLNLPCELGFFPLNILLNTSFNAKKFKGSLLW